MGPILEAKIGLDPGTVSRQAWDLVLQERLQKTKHASPDDYLSYLKKSKEELQAVVELIVVPETWFFRDAAPYAFITHYFKKELFSTHLHHPKKILSLACSTGEEPYSLVMALKEAGVPDKNYGVYAADISHKALEKAREGVYTKNSFRGKRLPFLSHYFTVEDKLHYLDSAVKEKVHFSHANLIDPLFPWLDEKFDIIFCRNILIYMSFEGRRKIFSLLNKLLAEQGVLVVTSVEAELLRLQNEVLLRPLKSGIFIRQSPEHQLDKKKTLNAVMHRATALAEKKDLTVGEIFQLADLGAFDKAEELCYEYLDLHGVSASVYFLLGLINHAKKKEIEAEEFFQKAIYLDPNHHETLVYLALLAEKRGDMAKAKLYHKRAKAKKIG